MKQNRITMRRKWYIVCLIAMGALVLAGFLSYSYMDLIVTQRHGIMVWDALFSGNIMHYYEYCAARFEPACYDFTMYVVFAIWNFPCWAFEKITATQFENYTFWLVYGKLFILLLYILSVRSTQIIYDKLSGGVQNTIGHHDSIIFFGSSLFLLIYAVYTGTYDIIPLNLILIGLIALMDEKKVKFLGYFAVAATLKYFALWIFIPLLLLFEKRIYRIILYVLACFTPLAILYAVFDRDAALIQSGISNWANFGKIYEVINSGKVTFFNMDCSICILLYALLCIFCFVSRYDNDKMNYLYIYISTLAWGIFFFFVKVNGHWAVLMAPFIMLLVISNKDKLQINILLEFVFSLTYVMMFMISQSWVLGGFKKSSHLLAGRFVEYMHWNVPSEATLGYLLMGHNDNYGIGSFIYAIMLATFISLMIMNCPSKMIREKIPQISDSLFDDGVAMMVRNIANCCLYILPTLYYLYFIKTAN